MSLALVVISDLDGTLLDQGLGGDDATLGEQLVELVEVSLSNGEVKVAPREDSNPARAAPHS